MLMTQQEAILTKILNCGTADLLVLEDIKYDLDDILDDLMENDSLSFNSLLIEVFRKGLDELKEVLETNKYEIFNQISNIIEEIREELSADGLNLEDFEDEDDYQSLVSDLELLKSGNLIPDEDYNCYVNYLDSHIAVNHIDFYRRWMPETVENIESNMGFSFEG